MVVAIFMLLFGINFNIFYFIIIGKIGQALKSEELRTYLFIIVVSTLTITLNLIYSINMAFPDALKDSFFQVVSFMTSTGFVSTNYDMWPELSQIILFILMWIGFFLYEPLSTYSAAFFLIIISQRVSYKNKTTHFLGKICLSIYLTLHFSSLVLQPYLTNEFLWMVLNAGLIIGLSMMIYGIELVIRKIIIKKNNIKIS
jgi:trk system potassium uptake protein TrkH